VAKLTSLYLKAKYKCTNKKGEEYILCQSSEDKFWIFKTEDFTDEYSKIELGQYWSSDSHNWLPWAGEAIQRVLSGELKPFYTAGPKEKEVLTDKSLCTCPDSNFTWIGGMAGCKCGGK
jgi:hypothetical protein